VEEGVVTDPARDPEAELNRGRVARPLFPL